MSRTRHRRRASFPLMRSLELVAECPSLPIASGTDLCTLWVRMLPSINSKHTLLMRVRQEYWNREQIEIQRIFSQVCALSWQTQQEDRYLLLVEFTYHTELREDTDNPLKPTIDCLEDGRALHNDNRVLGVQLVRQTAREVPTGWARITIFRTTADIGDALSQRFVQQWHHTIADLQSV